MNNINRTLFAAATLFIAWPAYADPQAEVLAANQAFGQATSKLDLSAIDALWIHDQSATVIHPSSKEPVLGWDAVHKTWEGFVGKYSEASVTMSAPEVRILNDAAFVVGVEDFHAKRTSGEVIEFKALTTNIFILRDGKWLMTHHHSSRMP